MPFVSARLMRAMADETPIEHQPTDDLQSHAWVLLWEFAFACVENNIDVARSKDQLEALQSRSARALASEKIATITSFVDPYELSPSLKTLSLVLGPWFKVVQLAEYAMRQKKETQGGGSPGDAQARMQKIFEAAYQQCILAVDQAVLKQLPETWAELGQARLNYDALWARIDQIQLVL
jgi:hypothetical protein